MPVCSVPTIEMSTPVDMEHDDFDFDLDVEVTVQTLSANTAITSKFICTPGCTSPGGGSFCSYCC